MRWLRRTWTVARIGARTLGLAGRLGLSWVALRWHRRKALDGFRRGLREYGVPDEALAALAEAYPDVLRGLNLRGHGPGAG